MQVTVKAKKYNKPQRSQSSAKPVTEYEKAASSGLRTRMTRIAQIYTDFFNRCKSLFHHPNTKPQRSQSTQSRIAILFVLCGGLTLFTANEEKTNSEGGRRITRIYPYPCASASSAQSAFYYIPSTFYVHPRLIMSMKEKTAAFYYATINKTNTIFNQNSDLNDRHLLLQRT